MIVDLVIADLRLNKNPNRDSAIGDPSLKVIFAQQENESLLTWPESKS